MTEIFVAIRGGKKFSNITFVLAERVFHDDVHNYTYYNHFQIYNK